MNTKFLRLLAFLAVLIAVTPLTALAQTGERYCEIRLSGCPQDYDGKELVVPLNVIAISTLVQACGYTDSVTSGGGSGAPPSIVFVIDQSASMYGVGYDPDANRYKVVSALLDTLYLKAPKAEVSVVVFRDDLLFDVRNDNSARRAVYDSNLVRYTETRARLGGSGNGGYMPFLTLNDTSGNIIRPGNNNFGYFSRDSSHSGGNALTGYDVLKNMMKTRDTTTGSGNNRRTFQDIDYRPFYGSSGTNVTRAFDAARHALQSAKHPLEDQYIIFISDGESNRPDGNNSTAVRDHYMLGDSVPTTFTVFLSPTGTAHPNLQAMSDNIRANNQDSSNIWALTSDYDAILELMMENIIRPMLSNTTGDAKSIVISSGNVSDSTGVLDGSFIFNRRLPIDTMETTSISMGIRYDIQIDSIWFNTATNAYDTIPRLVRDSLFTYTVSVRRSADVPGDWATSQELMDSCGVKPTLTLLHGQDPLATSTDSIVGEIRGSMERLTVVVNNTGGLFNYGPSMTVQVMNADSTFTDIENFTLRQGTGANSNIYTVTFPRVVDTAARSGDGTLQHAVMDSIVVVFRNPEIPLDTLRIAVPFVSHSLLFYDRAGDPNTGTPRPRHLGDAITVVAGDTTNIFAKFFDADGGWDEAFESEATSITWTVSDRSNASITGTGIHGLFYSETSGNTYTVTATYRDGSMIITNSMLVTVEPAAARYLEVLFDTTGTRIAGKVEPRALEQTKIFEFEKDADRTTFHVIERDRFGNYIGFADGSSWSSNNTNAITAGQSGNGTSALIQRHGHSFGDSLFVTVSKNGLSTNVHIKVIGESSVAIGPNPFIPGQSDVVARLQEIDRQSGGGTKTYDFYKDIIDGARSGGANSSAVVTGVLIAATAPRTIQRNQNGSPRAIVVIYDAVGNVVFRSKPDDLVLAADGNTFGFVWDGRNMSGRTVGPGTYLVRMVGTQVNGDRFSSQRYIGVTR